MKKIISLALVLVLMATILVGCGEKAPAYTDGTYEGKGMGMGAEGVTVSVEVVDGKIAKVEVLEHEETPGFYEEAVEKVPAAIVEKNSTKVEVVAGATMTSEAIMEAVEKALEDAVAK